MPLSEFYRLARGNCKSAKQKEAAGSTDLPIAPNNHLADLALGNYQFSLQGHSARGSRSSTSSYNEQFNNLRFQNSVLGNTSNSIERAEAFNDFPTPVSSVGVGNGDAMPLWLSYNLLTELPPVTLNDSISGATSIPSDMRLRSRKFQSLPFKSGSEIISICDSDTTKKALVFPSIRVQNQDSGIANSNSSFVNFSHFRRPSNHQSKAPCLNDMPILGTLVRDPGGMTKDTSTTGKSILGLLKGSSKPAATMPLEGSRTAEKSEALHQENAVKGKRVIEPIVASTSVSSGNSVEGVSDNPTQNLKRKFREIDEHEGLSEDLEDEFVGTGKSAPTKGGAGSKRGRAAEVHNLSERRRRDRINEKMRALQELIPNCNKVDKASMLDEAIQYMKTLQLQLQIMSMGAGLYVPPMMLTPQMQVAHMRLFAPMGTGYGLGMNPIAHVPLGAYFPGPSLQPVAGLRTSQPMAGLNFSSLGHSSQGPPLVPRVNTSPVDINANASTAASHFKTPSNANDLVQNDDSQLIGNADAGGSEKPKVIQCQPTVKSFEESNLSVKHDLPSDACSSDEVIFDKLKNIVSSTIK